MFALVGFDASDLEVKGGKHLLEVTAELAKKYESHPKMNRMPYLPVGQLAEAKRDAITKLVAEVENQTLPFHTPNITKSAVEKAVVEFDEAMKDVVRYKRGLQTLQVASATTTLEKRRAWRNKRNRYKKVMNSISVPRSLAKVMADHLQCLSSPPKEAQVKVLFEERRVEADTILDDEYCRSPIHRTRRRRLLGQ